MTIYNKRPAGSSRDEENGKKEERQYRAEVVSLNMGGQNAEIGQYMGVTFVPMRVVNLITTPGGVRKNAFALDGFDPDTGKITRIFFDTKLRKGTNPANREYVQNWGGGIAMTLCELATPREAQAVLEEVNEENGTDIQYDWNEWDDVGGLLKLREDKYGKPMLIGKMFVETKKGGFKMNVFKYDPLPKSQYPELENDKQRWESLRGEPYSPDEEEAYASSDSDESVGESDSVEEVWIPEPEPEKKPASKRSQPVTRTRSREENAKEVAKEFDGIFNRFAADAPEEPKVNAVSIPDSISNYIKEGFAKPLSTDEIMLGLITEKGLKAPQATEYMEAWLDKREGNGRSPKITRPVTRVESKPEQPKESELVRVARDCKEKGMDSPETFDVLQKKFPNISRDEKRAALKQAGLIRA